MAEPRPTRGQLLGQVARVQLLRRFLSFCAEQAAEEREESEADSHDSATFAYKEGLQEASERFSDLLRDALSGAWPNRERVVNLPSKTRKAWNAFHKAEKGREPPPVPEGELHDKCPVCGGCPACHSEEYEYEGKGVRECDDCGEGYYR